MIHADLHGKIGVPEDVLTSSCLGLLHLLPDENLIEVLSLAQHRNGYKITLPGVCYVSEEIEFWPRLRDGGEPDAIATIVSDATSRPIKIVIEVKHGSGKSGGDQDQLVKYYNAAIRQHMSSEILLIYLTHHRAMPVWDLDASLSHLPGNAEIYWLSWCSVAEWAAKKLKDNKFTLTERRIVELLYNYLVCKGYQRFEKWPVCGNVVKPLYDRNYSVRKDKCNHLGNPIYGRSYIRKTKAAIAVLYNQGGN